MKNMTRTDLLRRDFFRILGISGTGIAIPTLFSSFKQDPQYTNESRAFRTILEKIYSTPLIDTHEHLYDEVTRTTGGNYIEGKCNDWTIILNHYLDSDMLSAGMSKEDYTRFFEFGPSPLEKWKILEPWWLYVRNTGYGKAVEITLRDLYGISELSAATVNDLQQKYEAMVKPGFYKYILKDKANIQSCQVNRWPLLKSKMPDFLMSDLDVSQMIEWPGNYNNLSETAQIHVNTLEDWHKVIDWWFDHYSDYVVGLKIGLAYRRKLDFEMVDPVIAEKLFARKFNGDQITAEEQKKIEDHLFWYVIGKATGKNLPVKMHTGYHAQWAGKTDRMNLYNVRDNAVDACRLCDLSPETRFVFFHICYPYYEEMLTVAKQFHNANIDMCWSWIINPIAAKDFLKKYLVTAPANKLFLFGGDYTPVEPVYGHSVIAKNGLAMALSELVEEGYISMKDALQYTDVLMHQNAERFFQLEKKTALLKGFDWDKV
jgi:predicted TIM-barrel fold metal-dependent hydrolase